MQYQLDFHLNTKDMLILTFSTVFSPNQARNRALI